MRYFFNLLNIISAGLVLPALLLPVSYAYAECTPTVIVWDKTTHNLPGVTHDYKPMLESMNIAGGRYKLGVLLTTEWGAGGKVAWEGDKETITPEAPLEPGTQYKVWTYTYTSGVEGCPAYGGGGVFFLGGEAPLDKKPVRNIDISTIYHGNEQGSGKIEGEIIALNDELKVLTVKESFMKSINV